MTLSFSKPAFKQSVKSMENIEFFFVKLIIFLTKMTTVPLEVMFICQAVDALIIHNIVHKIGQLTFSYPYVK